MRYGKMRNQLVRCIGSLHTATAAERQKMLEDFTNEGSLEDSDESPSGNYGYYETAFKVDTYKQVHDSIVTLFQCATVEELTEIMYVFAEAFSDPPEPESSLDESMPDETASQRQLRHQSSERGEVSDPDEWAR